MPASTLREDFEAMVHDEVQAIGQERQTIPTDRAREAQRELRRRRLLEAAERDRRAIAAVLAEHRGRSWQTHTHAADWEEWAGWVRFALDFSPWESARGIRLHPENGASVTVGVPPIGAGWTFWPPTEGREGGRVPEGLLPLAWELARRGGLR